jgi:hypothetical protein
VATAPQSALRAMNSRPRRRSPSPVELGGKSFLRPSEGPSRPTIPEERRKGRVVRHARPAATQRRKFRGRLADRLPTAPQTRRRPLLPRRRDR